MSLCLCVHVQAFDYGLIPGLALSAIEQGRSPLTLKHGKPDHEATEPVSLHSLIQYLKPDGMISYDVPNSLYRRAGVIVNASETKAKKKPKSVNINGIPTRVLLLRNMVDDKLEDEVASECAKYGTVTRVLIFEIIETNFPVDKVVWIFVQFERSEETTKALIDLDGCFFGGRTVHANFFDKERFGKNELAPVLGEVPGYP
ncbi:hypothetical protein IFM89_010571 [Coptis chinensis]|uniref:RRM domain-containing protein n=1 Tax=Coptis chinensis TaxID=261450 RepID=A0A835IJ82_9MAGN|nr:hypothetical protein IFM89_010571 [Coptis chinensis]